LEETMILGECGMQNAECGMKIPNSLFDRFKNPQSAFRIPQSKGFTLIEVILVMVIIGILAATVVPRIDFTISTTASVDGAAYIVASDIRYAQEFAMANRISKTLTFTSGSSVYTFGPPSNMDPSGQLPEGVRVGTTILFTFNSLGEPIVNGGMNVIVKDVGSPQQRTIQVQNYTGKVKISNP
jgi:prepilin-type N-terminal cleavage/methylation domain-containing protein